MWMFDADEEGEGDVVCGVILVFATKICRQHRLLYQSPLTTPCIRHVHVDVDMTHLINQHPPSVECGDPKVDEIYLQRDSKDSNMIFEAQQLMPLCLWVISFMTVYVVTC